MSEATEVTIKGLETELELAKGEIAELKERLASREDELGICTQRIQAEKDRYGKAIQVAHHGLRECIRQAGEGGDILRALCMSGMALGYAFGLEVLTRRPAPDHMEAAFKALLAEEVDLAAAVTPDIRTGWEVTLRSFPQPPHVAYEKRRAAQ